MLDNRTTPTVFMFTCFGTRMLFIQTRVPLMMCRGKKIKRKFIVHKHHAKRENCTRPAPKWPLIPELTLAVAWSMLVVAATRRGTMILMTKNDDRALDV
jgi:hypothetical protein